MTELLTIDPELEGLLRELAADPESSLLRVPRGKCIRSFFDHGPALSSRNCGLSVLERHLVQAHRSELAQALRQVCIYRLLNGTKSRYFVSGFVTADRQFATTTLLSGVRSLGDKGIAPGHDQPSGAALQILEQCLANPASDIPTISEIAAAAFHLERTDDSRALSAIELARGTAPRTALKILDDIISKRPQVQIAGSAWASTGLALSKLLDFESAQRAYRMVCRLNDAIVTGWVGLFMMSLQRGDAQASRLASDALDDLAGTGANAIDDWSRNLAHRRKAGDWRPTTRALTTASQNADHFGWAARRLADAMV